MKRRTIFIALLVLLSLWVFLAAIGTRASGVASTGSDIPFVGEHLGQLRFLQPVKYWAFEHPHGGGTCRISGQVSEESLQAFCDAANISLSQDGTEMLSREQIITQVRESFVDLESVEPSNDALVLFDMSPVFPHLYGVYDRSIEHLWLHLQFAD